MRTPGGKKRHGKFKDLRAALQGAPEECGEVGGCSRCLSTNCCSRKWTLFWGQGDATKVLSRGGEQSGSHFRRIILAVLGHQSQGSEIGR